MIKKMLINAQDPEELRVAIVEDGRLEFFYVETAAREQTRANIYKGVVVNLEPSLQAAFVDYGQPRHGFLQVSDLSPELMPQGWEPGQELPSIKKILRKGQQILVQVVKEQTGSKGAALTTNLSLPGQSLVLTVGRESFGVSRQIASESERGRLKKILGELKLPETHGIIARTAAEGRSKKDIQSEARLLLRLWKDLVKRASSAGAPSLIHKEDDLALRSVRDFFTSDVSEILVDDPEVYERVERFLGLVNPRRKNAVKLYRGGRPILNKYEIEQQLQTIYQPTVRLPSGGSIVIQPTEALVSVDVNSGKSNKGKELEETALTVNLEAAAEVARQLRLRDLGGLVVIDFIDMRERKHQRAVRNKLKEELKKDKARTTVGPVSRFGLIEMSRQRIRPPVDFGATRSCPHCQGRGVLRSVEAAGRAALRELERRVSGLAGSGLRVALPPETAHYLVNNKRAELSRLEARSGACLEVVEDCSLPADDMRVERLASRWPLPEGPAGTPPPAARPALEPEPEQRPCPKEAKKEPAKSSGKKRSRRRRSGAARRRSRSRTPAGANGQSRAAASGGEQSRKMAGK